MATVERWFVLSYDVNAKAYKRNDVKEDIAEFLLLLKKEKTDLKIRKIESHTDSTIHFALDTDTALTDFDFLKNEFETHTHFKSLTFSLSLIAKKVDDTSVFYVKSKQPLKDNFDTTLQTLKKSLEIK